jgi:RNA polymerase sigma factor (sigma-70 family)
MAPTTDAGVSMRTILNRFPACRPRRRLRKLRPFVAASIYDLLVKPLDSTSQARAAEYTRIAYQLAWKFARRHARDVPAEELVSEALYALTYAAGLFDEAREVPFGAYATMVIKHRLIQAITNWRRLKVCPTPLMFDGELEREAQRRPVADVSDRSVTDEMCERVRNVLPRRWYDILHLYHGEGYTLEEIGDRLGVSRQRVGQLVGRAEDRLKRVFPEWTRF